MAELGYVFGQPQMEQPHVEKLQVYEKFVFTACKNPTVTKHVLLCYLFLPQHLTSAPH